MVRPQSVGSLRTKSQTSETGAIDGRPDTRAVAPTTIVPTPTDTMSQMSETHRRGAPMNNVQLFLAIGLPIAFNAIGFLLLRASISDLRDSLTAQMDDLAKRLDGRIDALGQRLDGRIDELRDSLNKRLDDIHRRLDDARGPVRPDAAGGRR